MMIFIGDDARQRHAAQVCAMSILECSRVVQTRNIKFLTRALAGYHGYDRPDDPLASTDFSFSRFMVPAICGYQGMSLFVDGDFVFTDDVFKLFDTAMGQRPVVSVSVVKHQYVPRQTIKMDGKEQVPYPRKNWSSLMLFNNAKCKALSARTVNERSAKWLHQFDWCRDDEIGSLPPEWNFLVGEYPQAHTLPRGIHYTNGIPSLPEYAACDYASVWRVYSDLVERNGRI